MYTKLVPVFIITAIKINEITAAIVNSKEQRIQELEKQKGKLFHQINAAIDDSVNTLNKTNDTDAVLTLNHLKELKKQIKELNATEDDDRKVTKAKDGSSFETEHQNTTDVRRYGAISSNRNPKLKLDIVEVAALLKKQGDRTLIDGIKNVDEHRMQVEKKLEMWIKEKRNEKKRIRDNFNRIQQQNLKFEICPRLGFAKLKEPLFRRKAGKHNGKKSKKEEKEEEKKKEKNKKIRYPCCRKCCKKSYMGCL